MKNKLFNGKSAVSRWLGICFIFALLIGSAFYRAERVAAVTYPTDFTFGTNGTVITNISSYINIAEDIVVQPDGKTLVVGYSDENSQPPYFTVTRYNANGSLDTSFDGDGIVNGRFRPFNEYRASYGRAVALQTDGKIIVAGEVHFVDNGVPFNEFAVARLNPDGSFDASFNGNGSKNINIGPQHDRASKVAVQSDGKIVVGGITGNETNYALALARLNPNGSLDTTFSDDGMISYINEIRGYCPAVLPLPDGKLLVVANINTEQGSILLLRYNPDGTPDLTFDGDGRLYESVLDPTSAVLQPDGKILVGGSVGGYLYQYAFALARFNSNGSRDASFGNGGHVVTDFGDYMDMLRDITVLPDGKIVAVGFTSLEFGLGVPSDFALAKYNANGSLDTSFDLDGKIVKSIGSIRENARAVTVEPNGKILLAGTAGPTDVGSVVVMRFMGDIHSADFDGDSRTDVSVWRASAGTWYLLQSANGFTAVNWGASSDKHVPGDYTGDGKTDVAVFRPSTGEWFVLRSENNSFFSVRFGIATDKAVPADYDGDGRTDIAVYRAENGFWFRLNSSDGSFSSVSFGSAEDQPTVGDFDGDGRADISLFRPSSGSWYRLNSSNGQFVAAQFGNGSDYPVAADFDGDSRADIAIFRSSNGVWYWLESSDGDLQSRQWGQNGDVPVPADYDGNGRFEQAVYRQGIWYILKNDLSSYSVQFGQTGDVPLSSPALP